MMKGADTEEAAKREPLVQDGFAYEGDMKDKMNRRFRDILNWEDEKVEEKDKMEDEGEGGKEAPRDTQHSPSPVATGTQVRNNCISLFYGVSYKKLKNCTRKILVYERSNEQYYIQYIHVYFQSSKRKVSLERRKMEEEVTSSDASSTSSTTSPTSRSARSPTDKFDEAFQKYDTNKDGFLSKDEFREVSIN